MFGSPSHLSQVSRVAHLTVCSHAAPHYPGGTSSDASSTFSLDTWPSLYVRQVGFHDCPFGACSGFTHVAACELARPPFEAFCLWASSPRVAPCPRQIATEGVDFLLGRDFHPLVKCTFHGARTLGAHGTLRVLAYVKSARPTGAERA